jgi:hypothetical protein
MDTTKTEETSGEAIVIDFRACALALVPEEERKGPLIIRIRGGLPHSEDTFQEVWRDMREAAGIPKDIWNRDLRASGSTEARRRRADQRRQEADGPHGALGDDGKGL